MSKLSFSLHKYDSAMTQLLREVRTGLESYDEILGKIRSRPVSHGGSIRQVSEPKIVDTPMQRVGMTFEMKIEAFEQTDVDQFVGCLAGSLDALFTDQKKRVFELLSITTEAVGNSIDAKGRSFWETYIEMLETTEMHFDEAGKPTSQIVVNPNTAKQMEETPQTPEQQQRIGELIEAKRREFYARKRSRKLSQ
jgi:hypothetical protein